MKRLIIIGIPCKKEAWENLFYNLEKFDQHIISFFEIIKNNYQKRNFYNLISPIEKVIQEFKPDEIVLHDMSVTLGLLALCNLKKKNLLKNCNVVIFNGAFRDFNIFKSIHPIRIQFKSFSSFKKEVENNDGELDERFKSVYGDIRHLYRQVVLFSIIRIFKNFFKKKPSKIIDLNCNILILASKNDPYIPFNSLKKIENDFKNTTLIEINYGHFPYSINQKLIQSHINKFLESKKL